MKKTFKALSAFFAVIMMFSILGVNAFAADEEVATKKSTKLDEIVASFNNPNGRLMSVANRGNWRNFPENSLEGIKSCIDMDVDIIAVDVQRTKDGKYVLMADSDLARMCVDKDDQIATSKVSEETLDEIKQYYFLRDSRGGLNSKSTEYKVPSLEEAINLCKDNAMLMINNGWKYGDEIQSIVKSLDADEYVILRGATTAEEITSYIHKNSLPISHICGYYEGKTASPAKKYVKETLSAGAKLIELSSASSHSSVFKKSVLNKFTDNGRAFISTTDVDNCGGREDIRSDWSDLISRGYSVIETNYPKELVAYIDEVESYRSNLSALISQAQGINTSNFSKETSENLKNSLKEAEEISSVGSTSLDDIDVAKYNLQQAIDNLTPRADGEKEGLGVGTIILIVVVVLVVLCLVVYYIFKHKAKHNHPFEQDENAQQPSGLIKRNKKRKVLKRRKNPSQKKTNHQEPPHNN